MTPTLFGRIQTRIIMMATLGVGWTAIIGWLLPRPDGVDLTNMYKALYQAVLVVAVVGVVWELIYHGLQQFRWEKDWPIMFGLLLAVPEGIVAYLILDAGLPWEQRAPDGNFPVPAFLIMFITLWLLIWAFTNGPMRIFSLRWRYRGGRFDTRWDPS
ncbi:MAG: hypothetical protein ABJH68_15950 [Ilumatobacter sp.]|uniref:hypothetical protein n=1 Tax=Ilumatobacter sp. TaxID=1967498 RepID=UPI00329937D6